MKTKCFILCFLGCIIVLMLTGGCRNKELNSADNRDESGVAADNRDESDDNTDNSVDNNNELGINNDGKWIERECASGNDSDDLDDTECNAKLRINVLEDMTEDEMLSVIDKYWEEKFNDGKDYHGFKVKYVYAIFYRNDTFDVIKKIKYIDGETQDINEDDERMFDLIILSDKEEARRIAKGKAEQAENE